MELERCETTKLSLSSRRVKEHFSLHLPNVIAIRVVFSKKRNMHGKVSICTLKHYRNQYSLFRGNNSEFVT